MKPLANRRKSAEKEQTKPAPEKVVASPRVLSGRRKWLFRFLAAVVVPLVLLGSLEGVLRLMGYGFTPAFFKTAWIGGRRCLVENDEFSRSFFPRRLARFPAPVAMPAEKMPGTCRIFIFGESAALGDPQPNFGAGCYLETLLANRFPEAKFEVINTAITAINSHAILPIARECANHAGDIWIIYMGNNEMVGPFGAATVFGARAPPLWVVRSHLALQRLRVGQLLLELARKLTEGRQAGSWHGMEMFLHNRLEPSDPRKERVYKNFRRNLADIVQVGLGSGASVVLSTVAVNLKDCPPFASVSGDALGPGRRERYEKWIEEAAAATGQGRFGDAQTGYEQAAQVCPDSAEAQFALGTCLAHQNKTAAARPHFLQAVDDDLLPFRADSRINDLTRDVARQHANKRLLLCDAGEALSVKTEDRIVGEESFYEHVHLNPNGNYWLGRAWAEAVEKHLSPALKGGTMPSWASREQCDQALGLTDWNRVAIMEEILRRIQRPPFEQQLGSAQRVVRLRAQIEDLRHGLTIEAAKSAREVYSVALQRTPENYRVHANYAEFLEASREWPQAVTERKRVCELIPHYYFAHYTLGMALKDAGALTEARATFLKASALNPDLGEIRLELGMVYARQAEWELARRALVEAGRLSPEEPRTPLYLGEVLWKLDRRDEALASLREAIRLAPSEWQPHYRLAGDLAQQGDLSQAMAEYQEALRLNPTNVKSKLGLAGVLLNLGRQPEAVRQVEEALNLEPNNTQALEMRRMLARPASSP